MFEAPQTSTPRERLRKPVLADAFVERWPNHIGPAQASSHRLILESDAQVVGLVGYQTAKLDVIRDHGGYHLAGWTAGVQEPNGVWVEELRVPRGIQVAQVRSLLRICRLVAMEHSLEWVGCRLDGPGWPVRASIARWRNDQDPILWVFWRESFVDVSENGELTMLWRNPAF